MKQTLLILLLVLVIPVTLSAAEVVNLKAGQSGDKGFATYDLSGKIGEREAEVTVTLTINGEKYSSDKLTLSGDLGKKIKPGVGKRINWDILADIPAGFDGEVLWNVEATGAGPLAPVKAPPGIVPAQAPAVTTAPAPVPAAQPFEFRELAARDKNTGLLWVREVSKNGNGVDFNKARGFAIKLATDKFAGCSEWRLPIAAELSAIVKYALEAGYKGKKSKGYPADFFNAIGFKGVANDYYWTAFGEFKTAGAHLERVAIDLEDGFSASKNTKDYLQFWPVCTPD